MTEHSRTHERPKRTPGEKTQRGVVLVAVASIVGISFVSLMLARATPDDAVQSGVGVATTALVLFFAAGAVGAGLGFLFGLPRSRFLEQKSSDGGNAPTGPVTAATSSFLTNSNLIKVSDWLTTIVVGLGLVNLANIGPALTDLQQNLVEPLGGSANAGVIGLCIVLAALVLGALLTFLWTSIRVRELFEDSERQFVPKLTDLSVKDAKAMMASTGFRLDLPTDAPDDAVVSDQSVQSGTMAPAGTEVKVEVERDDLVLTGSPTSGNGHSG